MMIHSLQRWDETLFEFINRGLANPLGDGLFPSLNHAAPFVPVLILALGWLAYRNTRRLWLLALVLVVGMALGDSLIFNPLKKTFGRPRPAAALKDVRALASGATGGYAFPSSHTANAFLAAAVLSAFYPNRKKLFWAGAGGIGFSRIYVGVHYPSDVLGSALLGWWVGKAYLGMGRHFRSWLTENALVSHGKWKGPGKAWTGILWLSLAGIQLARLLWAATTPLDVPPEAAHLWCLAESVTHGVSTTTMDRLLLYPAQTWFSCMGSSALSLWGIPWAFQTLWLFLLGWRAWKRGGPEALGSLVLLGMLIPLVSQLSFLGSAEQIFQDSDWEAPLPLLSWIWHGLLGLPLWIGALLQFRSQPITATLTLSGWMLASLFPSIPWWIPAWMSSGTMLFLAQRLGLAWNSLGTPTAGRLRFGLAILLAYGLLMSCAVYNIRFLRKLDISFLPRNQPSYLQTGWTEWIERIRPHLARSAVREIWTDSPLSRNLAQYLVGKSYRVFVKDNLANPSPGAFYIREVYLAQIHPRVLFIPRTEGFPDLQRHELDSTEIFRKGDPIRQFQLYTNQEDSP